MRAIVQLIGAIFLTWIMTAAAAWADTTFSCTAVRDKANVGVHDNVAVNITTSSNVCNFSVAGANVSSSAVSDFSAFTRALGDFVQGVQEGRSVGSDPLSRLFGTNDQRELDGLLTALADGGLESYRQCFESARSLQFQTFSSGNAFCTVIGHDTAELPGSVQINSPTGGVSFGARFGDSSTQLFVPLDLLTQAMQGTLR